MRKKWFLPALAALLASLVLFTFAACGGGDDEDNGGEPKGPVNYNSEYKYADAMHAFYIDGTSHMNPRGNFLAAAVYYAVLWGADPADLDETTFNSVLGEYPELIALVKKVAKEVVFSHPLSPWAGKTPGQTGQDKKQTAYFVGNSYTWFFLEDVDREDRWQFYNTDPNKTPLGLIPTTGKELDYKRFITTGSSMMARWQQANYLEPWNVPPRLDVTEPHAITGKRNNWPEDIYENWEWLSLQPYTSGKDIEAAGLFVDEAFKTEWNKNNTKVLVYAHWPHISNYSTDADAYAQWEQGGDIGKGIIWSFRPSDYDKIVKSGGNNPYDPYAWRWELKYNDRALDFEPTTESDDYFTKLTEGLRKNYPDQAERIFMVPVGHVMYEVDKVLRAAWKKQ